MQNLQPGADNDEEPRPTPPRRRTGVLDLLALVAVLAFVGVLAGIGTGQSGGARIGYWSAAAAVTVFGAWSRLRRPRDDRWSNGAITYVSRGGRIRASRAWGTASGPAPTLPEPVKEATEGLAPIRARRVVRAAPMAPEYRRRTPVPSPGRADFDDR